MYGVGGVQVTEKVIWDAVIEMIKHIKWDNDYIFRIYSLGVNVFLLYEFL